jgi:hypothetical protein
MGQGERRGRGRVARRAQGDRGSDYANVFAGDGGRSGGAGVMGCVKAAVNGNGGGRLGRGGTGWGLPFFPRS